MFFGSTATSLTPSRSAALRLAWRKSSMPCSAMILAASWARARRKSSARCENFLGIRFLEYRFLAFRVVRILPLVELSLGQISFYEFFHDAVGIIRAGEQSGLRRDANADDAVWNRHAVPGRAGKRLSHKISPGRDCRAAALLQFAKRSL